MDRGAKLSVAAICVVSLPLLTGFEVCVTISYVAPCTSGNGESV